MNNIITIPGLFMAMGAFIWIPLTIGMGRRPVFLLASLLTLFATLGTGYSQSPSQLMACMCIMSLGEAFALTAVRQ
jgi:MFS family permease